MMKECILIMRNPSNILSHETALDGLQTCCRISKHPELCRLLLSSDEAQFPRGGMNTVRNSHSWPEANPHQTKRVTSSIGITSDNPLNVAFLKAAYHGVIQNASSLLPDDVTLMTRLRMYLRHDGALPQIDKCQAVFITRILIVQIHSGSQLPGLRDLRTSVLLDYYLWGHMKLLA